MFISILPKFKLHFTLHLGFEKPATRDNLQQTAAKSQTKNVNAIWIFTDV